MNPHQQQQPQYPGQPPSQQFYPGQQQQMYNPPMGYPQGGQRYPVPYPQGEGAGSSMGQYGAMQTAQGTFQPMNVKQEPHWAPDSYQMQMQQQHQQQQQQQQQQYRQFQQQHQHPQQHMQPQQPQPQVMQQVPNPQYQHMEHNEHSMHTQQHLSHHGNIPQQHIQKTMTPHLQQPQLQHSLLHATQSGGQGSSTMPASTSSASSSQRITVKEVDQQQAQPKLFASDVAEDITKFNVGELCILGRELVSDLTFKTSQLASILKKVMEKKALQSGEDPAVLSDQCRQHLEKLVEIRLIVEGRRKPESKRMTAEDYIALVLEDDEKESAKEIEQNLEMLNRMAIKTSKVPPKEGYVWYEGRWIPESLHKKYLIFEENRASLVQLSCDMKALNWMVEVSSPVALKKVDKTKFTKKKQEV